MLKVQGLKHVTRILYHWRMAGATQKARMKTARSNPSNGDELAMLVALGAAENPAVLKAGQVIPVERDQMGIPAARSVV